MKRNRYPPKGQTGTNDRAIGKLKGKVVLDQHTKRRTLIGICDLIVALLFRVLAMGVSGRVHGSTCRVTTIDNVVVRFIKAITGLPKNTEKHWIRKLLDQ